MNAILTATGSQTAVRIEKPNGAQRMEIKHRVRVTTHTHECRLLSFFFCYRAGPPPFSARHSARPRKTTVGRGYCMRFARVGRPARRRRHWRRRHWHCRRRRWRIRRVGTSPLVVTFRTPYGRHRARARALVQNRSAASRVVFVPAGSRALFACSLFPYRVPAGDERNSCRAGRKTLSRKKSRVNFFVVPFSACASPCMVERDVPRRRTDRQQQQHKRRK